MSILARTYALCNAIQSMPARQNVLETFRLATTASSEDMFSGNNKGMLEYTARDKGAQFLSYLLTSQERDNFLYKNSIDSTSPLAYPPMDMEHIEVFENAHRTILELNTKCITPVVAITPNVDRALDPFGVLLPYRFVSPMGGLDLIPRKEADDLIQAFAEHPAVELAIEVGPRLDITMSKDDYVRSALQMRESIVRAGALAVPEGLNRIVQQLAKTSRDRMLLRYIASLVCIAASLRVLNQHIFQSIIWDKPLVLTEDLLIDNGFPSTTNLVGTGRTLLYQVPELHKIVEIFELILVKVPTFNVDELCEVASWRRTFRHGHTLEIRVRKVDDNLNPYKALLEHI